MARQGSIEEARERDEADALRALRQEFLFPQGEDGQELVYLCGNSLGLQPRRTARYVNEELEDWARLGVEGHFEGRHPWYDYHEFVSPQMARVVGARPEEVVVMNALTVNLHLLMVSFYRPTAQRYKIVIEAGAFPSDRYAVASQVAAHGLDPARAVVELAPREGEQCLRTEDVVGWLERHGQEVALVMLSGVQYYTGQAFDIERITAAGHQAGCLVGWDLAHAAGNLALELHDHGPDFAAWCSYKYLNAGPGGVAACFVHERWAASPELPRFAGWWGNDPGTRFEMPERFQPQRGAAGWQLSNAPVLPMAALRASLELFEEAGMARLRQKSLALTDYMLELIDAIEQAPYQVITPRAARDRGGQVSLLAPGLGRELFGRLKEAGVVCDYRDPDVVRVAAAPLYNSFEDVWRFCDILRQAAA